MPKKRVQRKGDDDGLLFINLSHPDDHHLSSNQTQVRQHVMRKIGQSRKKRHHSTNPLTNVAGPAYPPHNAPAGRTEVDGVGSATDLDGVEAYERVTSLQQIHIFASIHDATPRERELLYYLHIEGQHTIIAFRFLWLKLAIQDPAARQLTLANAALASANRYRGDEPYGLVTEHPEAIVYYSKSLVAVETRLAMTEKNITEGLIIAVLGFSCYDIRVGAWDRWNVHMDGIVRMVNMRGGFQGLSSSVVQFASWTDLNGSAVFDSQPRFPSLWRLPESRTSTDPTGLTHKTDPEFRMAEEALDLLCTACNEVNKLSFEERSKIRDLGIIKRLGPSYHYILSMPRLRTGQEGGIQQPVLSETLLCRELIRLASLVLLSQLKGSFHTDTYDLMPNLRRFYETTCLYQGRERSAADRFSHRILWLELWAFVTVALVLVKEPNKTQMVATMAEIGKIMVSLKVHSWDHVMEGIKHIAWVNHLHDSAMEALRGEFEQYRGWEAAIRS